MDQSTSESPFPPSPTPRSSGNIGPLAAAVVIVVLLAAGGFYFLWSQQQRQATQGTSQAAQAQQQASPTATNDSTQSIESDLNATQTSGGQSDVDNLNQAL